MKRVFIGLLVGICVIMFVAPLMAGDLPEGADLSTLQALDNAQLERITGKYQPGSLPNGFKNFTGLNPYPQGVINAYFANGTDSNVNPNTSKSKGF